MISKATPPPRLHVRSGSCAHDVQAEVEATEGPVDEEAPESEEQTRAGTVTTRPTSTKTLK